MLLAMLGRVWCLVQVTLKVDFSSICRANQNDRNAHRKVSIVKICHLEDDHQYAFPDPITAQKAFPTPVQEMIELPKVDISTFTGDITE